MSEHAPDEPYVTGTVVYHGETHPARRYGDHDVEWKRDTEPDRDWRPAGGRLSKTFREG